MSNTLVENEVTETTEQSTEQRCRTAFAKLLAHEKKCAAFGETVQEHLRKLDVAIEAARKLSDGRQFDLAQAERKTFLADHYNSEKFQELRETRLELEKETALRVSEYRRELQALANTFIARKTLRLIEAQLPVWDNDRECAENAVDAVTQTASWRSLCGAILGAGLVPGSWSDFANLHTIRADLSKLNRQLGELPTI